jgi:hypothetical protein
MDIYDYAYHCVPNPTDFALLGGCQAYPVIRGDCAPTKVPKGQHASSAKIEGWSKGVLELKSHAMSGYNCKEEEHKEGKRQRRVAVHG